jgi:hypothetical protein
MSSWKWVMNNAARVRLYDRQKARKYLAWLSVLSVRGE